MWTNVIGQARAKRILQQAIGSGRLAHAFLFSGQEGIGKDAAAIEFAKALNCERPLSNGTEACDECASCKSIASFQSPFVKMIFPLARAESWSQKEVETEIGLATEQLALKATDPYYNIDLPKAIEIKLDQIRNLRLEISRSVTAGKKRVVIISEADTMRSESQNALLKTLEEPQKHTIFILTSSNPSRLFATIHSRCQEIRFELLAPEDISLALVERDGIESEQAAFLGRLAGGSITVARSLASEDIASVRKQVVQFLRMGLSRSRKNLITEIDAMVPRRGDYMERRQTVEQLLRLLFLWFRDAIAMTSGNPALVVNSDLSEDLQKFTTRFNDPRRLAQAMHLIVQAQIDARLQLQLREILIGLAIELEETLLPKAA